MRKNNVFDTRRGVDRILYRRSKAAAMWAVIMPDAKAALADYERQPRDSAGIVYHPALSRRMENIDRVHLALTNLPENLKTPRVRLGWLRAILNAPRSPLFWAALGGIASVVSAAALFLT